MNTRKLALSMTAWWICLGAHAGLDGDTVYGLVKVPPFFYTNLWGETYVPVVVTADVTDPGIEFSGLRDSATQDVTADFSDDMLTIAVKNPDDTPQLTRAYRVQLHDLDYGADIIDVALVSATFPIHDFAISWTHNSITVDLPNWTLAAHSEFAAVFQVRLAATLLLGDPVVSGPTGRGIDNDSVADSGDNCIVNAADLGALKAALLSTKGQAPWNAGADTDGNGVVNVFDLGLIKSSLSTAPGPSDVQTINR